jgi:hypothetical protein
MCLPMEPLPPASGHGIHRSRFGCGSSRSMAMVIPPTNPKGGCRARRRNGDEASRDLEDPGSTAERSLATAEKPSDEFGGCPLPPTARHEGGRREGGPATLTRVDPSEGLDSRQRSREVRRTQCEVTGRLLRGNGPSASCVSGRFNFLPAASGLFRIPRLSSMRFRRRHPRFHAVDGAFAQAGGRSSLNSRYRPRSRSFASHASKPEGTRPPDDICSLAAVVARKFAYSLRGWPACPRTHLA